MTEPLSPERIPVHLLQLPVQVAARAQQHVEELLREFSLMHSGSSTDGRDVPSRLMELVEMLTRRFSGINDDATERLEAAIRRGDLVLADHVVTLPPEAGPASLALGQVLDEADDYCRNGQHLLTLATPQECLDYRGWYLSEVVRQLEGAPPTPWPDYRRG